MLFVVVVWFGLGEEGIASFLFCNKEVEWGDQQRSFGGKRIGSALDLWSKSCQKDIWEAPEHLAVSSKVRMEIELATNHWVSEIKPMDLDYITLESTSCEKQKEKMREGKAFI